MMCYEVFVSVANWTVGPNALDVQEDFCIMNMVELFQWIGLFKGSEWISINMELQHSKNLNLNTWVRRTETEDCCDRMKESKKVKFIECM